MNNVTSQIKGLVSNSKEPIGRVAKNTFEGTLVFLPVFGTVAAVARACKLSPKDENTQGKFRYRIPGDVIDGKCPYIPGGAV